MEEQIRAIIAAQGKLAVDPLTIGVDDDLFAAGMTSHASVNVMLALEDEFDVEFPDESLKRATFTSIRSMRDVIDKLVSQAV